MLLKCIVLFCFINQGGLHINSPIERIYPISKKIKKSNREKSGTITDIFFFFGIPRRHIDLKRVEGRDNKRSTGNPRVISNPIPLNHQIRAASLN